MSRNIYLARHGHREDFIGDSEQYNYKWAETAKNRYNPALSSLGKLQAQKLAEDLKNVNIDHLFSSPFLRTIETASFISKICGSKIKIENGLSEWLNPRWFPSTVQHFNRNQLIELFPGLVDIDYNPVIQPSFPEIYEDQHVWPRVAQTVNILLRNFDGDILLVGHGASIVGAAFCLAGGLVNIETRLCGLIHFQQQNKNWVLLKDGSPQK